jgi:hypothetical protein
MANTSKIIKDSSDVEKFWVNLPVLNENKSASADKRNKNNNVNVKKTFFFIEKLLYIQLKKSIKKIQACMDNS